MSLDMKDVTFRSEPVSAAGVAGQPESAVLLNRWLGAWIDLAVLASFLLIPDYLLGNDLYQRTIFVWLGLVAAYFPVTESLFGKTAGKFVTRIRVVAADGSNPSWLQSIIRTLFRLIEVNPLLLGGLPAGIAVLVSSRKQRIGDMVAATYVLRDKDVSKIRAGVT